MRSATLASMVAVILTGCSYAAANEGADRRPVLIVRNDSGEPLQFFFSDGQRRFIHQLSTRRIRFSRVRNIIRFAATQGRFRAFSEFDPRARRCWIVTIPPEYAGDQLRIAIASLHPCWGEAEKST